MPEAYGQLSDELPWITWYPIQRGASISTANLLTSIVKMQKKKGTKLSTEQRGKETETDADIWGFKQDSENECKRALNPEKCCGTNFHKRLGLTMLLQHCTGTTSVKWTAV